MVTNRMDINGLLSQMREMKAQASGGQELKLRSNVEAAFGAGNKATGVGAVKAPEFSEMLNNAVNTVNETQQSSAALATAYQLGDAGVSLSQVMVASQKASVSFQALTQVRNKLVDAYQDVMNMPI